MALEVTNSLSGEKEPFRPKNPNHVRIYTCGPTVYNFNHIGNFRSYVFADILRRYLILAGYGVDHTMNITDVEDKIIASAGKAGETIDELTGRYIAAFLEDIKALRIQEVEHRPRATRSIPKMLEMIGDLEKRGHTYQTSGSVYFRLSSFPDYGKLSRIDPDSLRAAADGRFEADEYTKENVRDFALWKQAAPSEPSWDSPWGQGRPGWHIECSAMIEDIYGKDGVDIHTGGIDLLFPHHENEIAQTCAANPGRNFVRYWMHNEHLLVDGKKMSKSLGNFFMLRDLLDPAKMEAMIKAGRVSESLREISAQGRMPRAMRYLLISTHYRHKLNFTFENLKASDAASDRIQTLVDRLRAYAGDQGTAPKPPKKPGGRFRDLFKFAAAQRAAGTFQEAMDDDLNTPRALAAIFELVRELNHSLEKKDLSHEDAKDALSLLMFADRLLDILDFVPNVTAGVIDPKLQEEVEELIERRTTAKKARDFKEADRIRGVLKAMGIAITDTPAGTTWEKTT